MELLEIGKCGLCGFQCHVSEIKLLDGDELCRRCFEGGTEVKRITELVKASRAIIEPSNPYTPDDLVFVMGVIEELAEKLGVQA